MINNITATPSRPLVGEEDLLASRYRWLFESPPCGQKASAALHLTPLPTPLGLMVAGVPVEGVCLLEFMNRIHLEKEIQELQHMLAAALVPAPTVLSGQLEEEVQEYFAGTRKIFSVPLHTPGTLFSQSVWQHLQRIPYGTTCSYQEQAARMGNSRAIRAIAAANGRNRLAILIPCHRVVGSNGAMTGYAAGVDKKKWLLQHERSHSPTPGGQLF
ncbi:methylated-DNA--[protein]-cysteine S-methyltransferase [Hymenobacter terrenus]|uniref:methylated-DNA--[protein]-cysteine S-methyltransferase n=1 Tax=Hymenobacter terrenus TaxID=1629124 RepID=UPI0009E238AD|nr:methylated-DNA--[protein]-cysteine S-methyltransferase [Hymenobacter terrenus]